MLYVIEQCLNGMQLGMLLFLLAAGLTLIFGIMDLVNLAHGSLYMLGAYFAATFITVTDSFLAGIGLGLIATKRSRTTALLSVAESGAPLRVSFRRRSSRAATASVTEGWLF